MSVLDLGKPAPKAEDKPAECKYTFASWDAIMAPLAPVDWICERLGIASGGVTIIGGAGYGGKTIACQMIALAVASGTKAFGEFECAQGSVVHYDYEQGPRLTYERYQRQARAIGVHDRKLGDRLRVTSLPKGKLSDADARDNMLRDCEGAKLCVVDSFRRAFPNAKENDSESSGCLDMLQRVSESTGCAMLLIMHCRKMGEDSDVRASLRGSSALFDAAQTVYMLEGAPGVPTTVHNVKDRLVGETRDTFGLRVVDVKGPKGELRWGLDVQHVGSADMAALRIERETAAKGRDAEIVSANHESLMSMVRRVVDFILGHRNKDGTQAGVLASSVSASMPGRTTIVNAALAEAVAGGLLTCEGRGVHATYTAVPPSREPGEEG